MEGISMSMFAPRRVRGTLLLGSLALCGATLFETGAQAATRTVTNCNNSGSGSLRAAAAAAQSDDTIDLSQLTCNRITLASEILLPQENIRLLGYARLALTLHGNHVTRVLHHTGTGTLSVERLSVSYGHVAGERVSGGCIESAGNVTLRQSRAHHCVVDASSGAVPVALGGAIHAAGFVLLDRSSVFDNQAIALAEADGGGIDSGGKTTLLQSQVYGNSADLGGGVLAENGFRMAYSLLQANHANDEGGGAFVQGNAEVNKSTVAGNHSNDLAGGMAFHAGSTPGAVATFADSTVSGNSSDGHVSALAFVSTTGRLFNTTVTANHEATTDTCWGAVFTFGMRLESTVASGNACDAPNGPHDVGDLPSQASFVTGSHNLVGSTSVSLPADTIFSDTPGLGPLAFNGGPTRTHAVLSGSLLIDHGNNVFNRMYDQRGVPYPRVNGPAPDIGAFER
jgi:hypothetical protein